MNNNDIRYEIVEKIGVLGNYNSGWKREINVVSWNDTKPKYDIREWSPEHDKMSRGITLNENEMIKLISKILEKHPKIKDAVVKELNKSKGSREIER